MRRLSLVAVLAVALTSLVGASSAFAKPSGEFEIFAQCPLTTPGLTACLNAKTESGEIVAGNRKVPIEHAITLQGGLVETETATTFIAAANGETLSKTPQNVPGGIFGVNCKEITEKKTREKCESVFENKLTAVSATTELAGPASDIHLNEGALFEEVGTALSIPVKLHVENPLLGSSCYIGSNSAPVVLELTTGTSGSLKGTKGEIRVIGEGEILQLANNSLVNNTFVAPGSNGCGPGGLLDGIVNSLLGVPAGSGKNKAVLNGILSIASPEAVNEH
jgi:hypothetical protein